MTKMTKKKIRKPRGHWTNRSIEDFQSRIAFDFIAQLEDRMDEMPIRQKDLAHRLHVSKSAVSQILNNPDNLELKTIIAYARALEAKVAVVLYDDADALNLNGPVNSELFTRCWESMGRPTSFLTWNESRGMPENDYEQRDETKIVYVDFGNTQTAAFEDRKAA